MLVHVLHIIPLNVHETQQHHAAMLEVRLV